MISKEYRGIRYDDPSLQTEFERLVGEVSNAERARAPFKEQFEEAEQAHHDGRTSRTQFEAAENKYMSANNTIARAKRAVDQFLGQYKNYRVER